MTHRYDRHDSPSRKINSLGSSELFRATLGQSPGIQALSYSTHIAKNIERFALCFVLCVFVRPHGCRFSSAESQYFDII